MNHYRRLQEQLRDVYADRLITKAELLAARRELKIKRAAIETGIFHRLCSCQDCGPQPEDPQGEHDWFTISISFIWLILNLIGYLILLVMQMTWSIFVQVIGENQQVAMVNPSPYTPYSWEDNAYCRSRGSGMTHDDAVSFVEEQIKQRLEEQAKQRERRLEAKARQHERMVEIIRTEMALPKMPSTSTDHLIEKATRGRNQRDRVHRKTSPTSVSPGDAPEEECHDRPLTTEEPRSGFNTPATKVKVKSRHHRQSGSTDSKSGSKDSSGASTPPTPASPATPTAPNTPPPTTPTIMVGSTSYELFQKMLTCKKSSKSPVKFDDLVEAMVDAGFTVRNGSGGSSVKFIKDGVGSTSFHRPHPDGIQYDKLRTWGRRFKREFGWNEDTFVEREE